MGAPSGACRILERLKRAADYAEAASRFAMQLTALQAAQQVTVRIQGLSLFNRL